MMQSFFEYLESVFEWFFGSQILADPLFSLVTSVLEYILGVWLLYTLLVKPIRYIINVIDVKIYGGK